MIFGAAQALIVLQIILEAFHGNKNALFVQWVFQLTSPLLQPFAGIFPNLVLADHISINLAAVFALIIYSLLGYIVENIAYSIERRITKH
jgi:uncharacterized protein YggT (Ycf19 family)